MTYEFTWALYKINSSVIFFSGVIDQINFPIFK